jgi:plasmid maintenance system antidote protein VapI
MKEPNQMCNRWIKSALMDRDLHQRDLAARWNVTDAVVSRFINSGTPELTWERACVLADMFGLSLDELRDRLSEGK